MLYLHKQAACMSCSKGSGERSAMLWSLGSEAHLAAVSKQDCIHRFDILAEAWYEG